MNKFLFVLSTIISLIFSESKAGAIPSTAKAVTIFRNGAQVTRTAFVSLKKGTHEYAFAGFSHGINPSTLQIGADADFTLISSSNRIINFDSTRWSTDYRDLNRKFLSFENRRKDEQNILDTYHEEHQLLLLKNDKLDKQNISSPENLIKLADIYRTRLLEVKRRITEYNDKIAATHSEINYIQMKMNEISERERASNSHQLFAIIESPSDQTVEFTFRYQISGLVSWNSLYEMRLKDISTPLEIISKANIIQNSGEDWKQVSVILSSGNPSSCMVLPSLNPWWLVSYNNKGKFASAKNAQAEILLGEQNKDEDYNSQVRSNYRTVKTSVEESLTANEFTLEEKLNIPSSFNTQSITIFKQNVSADYKYRAIPKKNKFAYLFAQVADWEKLNLSTGEANIYFKNTYVGQTLIDPASIQDTFEISLGQDIAVICKRTKTKNETKKEFLSSKFKTTLAYQIEIKNNKSREINIEVQDQYPLSSNSEYEVNVNDVSGAAVDKTTGIITWNLKIPASQSIQKNLSYTVEYPKNRKPILE